VAKVVLLDTTGAEAGALSEVGDEPAVVTAASDDELEDLDLVFFCGPAAVNREWIEHYKEDRFTVVDLSQPSTIEGGKIVVAGINLDESCDSDPLTTSPHPIAIPIAHGLLHIKKLGSVELTVANVVQPASE